MLFIGRKDPQQLQQLQKHSDVNRVIENAKKYFNDDNIEVYMSTNPSKKYMIFDPEKYKFIHFGDIRYKDYTYTLSDKKRDNYLKRSEKIKGDWKNNKYSANNLAINLLWN